MRFFVSAGQISGELLTLDESDAQHISRVLRMRPGEEITVCCDRLKNVISRVLERSHPLYLKKKNRK